MLSVSLAMVFYAPLFVLAWWVHRARRRLKTEMLDPFTRYPLRPPGESLRLKIEELKEQLDEAILFLLLTALACAIVVATVKPFNFAVFAGAELATLAALACTAPKIVRLTNELHDYRLGFMGERVVGEELNQLVVMGFRVFHDVPFEKFNLDHVLVGPSGVYVVETKAKRKDARIKGLARATVVFDGAVLQFPKSIDREFLQQARRSAQSLGRWLTSATGERVEVNAILTLPGWKIERVGRGDVNVLRPDEIKRSFPSRPEQPLGPEQIQRIAHPLAERCRLSE